MSILFLNVGSNSVFCSNLIELVFFSRVGLLVVPTFMRKKRKEFQKKGLYHTLEFLIRMLHFLFFFGIFSYLHRLIRNYTFIYF